MDAIEKFAQRAREIDPRAVRRKTSFNIAVMIVTLIIAAVDLWAIRHGWATTTPEKRLAGFILLGTGACFVVALLAFISLRVSVRAYRQLDELVSR